jgi:hypothetical protein
MFVLTTNGRVYQENGTVWDDLTAQGSSTAPADITSLTNAAANSSYPTGAYAFNVLATDGYPADGRLTGARSGTLNAQRLQLWSFGETYSRVWLEEGLLQWSDWSLDLNSSGFTAKGQTYFSSGINTADVLAAPTSNNQTILSDSTQLLGVKWGAGASPFSHIFRLPANETAFGPAIGDFFGANSAFVTEANTTYRIVFDCYFLKTTAGTVSFTVTNTSNYAAFVGTLFESAVGGAHLFAGPWKTSYIMPATAVAAAVFPANGTGRTTGVNHHDIITCIVTTTSAGNIRLRSTGGAGTITPLRNSLFTVEKLSNTNTGAFAA